jgi:hypothetical protein
VVVDGNEVKASGRILGPLAGAHAEVTDPTSRHTLTRVVTVAGEFTKKTKATMMIVYPDGTCWQRTLDGAAAVRQAQAWVIQFNALAAAPPLPPRRPQSTLTSNVGRYG